MPSTYDLTSIARDIAAAVADPDGDAAAALAALDVSLPEAVDQWRVAAEDKARALGVVSRRMDADIAYHKGEAQRHSDAVARLVAGKARIADMALALCDAAEAVTGAPKIGDLRRQANPPALVGPFDEPARWPAAYLVEVPATWRLDRAALKAALVAGAEIEGFRLTVGTSLRGLK